MGNVRKGQLVPPPEWWKHLRPAMKRLFWKRNRAAERNLARSGTRKHP